MIQVRVPGDARRYSPDRDVAHHFPHIGRLVADKMAEKNWSELLLVFLKHHGTTEADLGEAMAAMARFFSLCVDPELDLKGALAKSGWLALPIPAQFAVCASLGQAMIGVYFRGIRDAIDIGEGPAANVKELVRSAERAYEILTKQSASATNDDHGGSDATNNG